MWGEKESCTATSIRIDTHIHMRRAAATAATGNTCAHADVHWATTTTAAAAKATSTS